jgi:hypothetical protein
MDRPTLSRADVERVLVAAAPRIQALGVRRLALFGSFGRDEATPHSDVDLLVEFEPARKSFDAFADLGDLLETLLDRTVELVTPESVSPFFRPHILRGARDIIRPA